MIYSNIFPNKIQKNLINEREIELSIYPLDKGYGHTLGNLIINSLLTLEGKAIVEFSCNKDIFWPLEENISDIVQILSRFRPSQDSGVHKVKISRNKSELESGLKLREIFPYKASDPAGDTIISFFKEEGTIEFFYTIDTGCGHSLGKGLVVDDNRVCFYPNIIFSPVLKSEYVVEKTRVKEKTDYDKLVLFVTTDGSISPEDAIKSAGLSIKDVLASQVEMEDLNEKYLPHGQISEFICNSVAVLDLSSRSKNCLLKENILYIGDLITKTKQEMLQTPRFGKRSLSEIEERLSRFECKLGTEVPDWPNIRKNLIADQS